MTPSNDNGGVNVISLSDYQLMTTEGLQTKFCMEMRSDKTVKLNGVFDICDLEWVIEMIDRI